MIEVVGGIDLILIEGGKSENIPKIAVGEIELLDQTIFKERFVWRIINCEVKKCF